MNPSVLLVDNSDPAISIVMLNRPDKRNALSVQLLEEIVAAVASISQDRTRRVLVLAGNGPAFCAGLDLHEASAGGSTEKSAEALAGMYEAIGSCPLITIAVAAGAAMGGGAGLLAACDFVVAADDLKIAYPEVKRGLVAALVTCLLRRRLNDGAARELILLGQDVPAERALELGLISQIVAGDALMSAALSLARRACEGAPGAIERTKQLLDTLAPRSLKEDLRMALDVHLSARHSTEAAEGMAAFKEKRKPNWGPRPQ